MTWLTVDPGKWHAAGAFVDDNNRIVEVIDAKHGAKDNPALAVANVALQLFKFAERLWLAQHNPRPLRVRLEEPSAEWSDYEERSKAARKDVPFLMLMNGAISMAFASFDVKLVTVNDWKGSVPKDIHQRRILKHLRKSTCARERELFPLERFNKDKVDAAGIGLWAARRMV